MPDKDLTPEEESANREILRFVKPWMVFRRLSQKRISEELGVSQATVSKWLSGRQAITIAQLSAIARLLLCSPEDILAGPPTELGAGTRLRRLVELTESLSPEQLDAMIAVGEQFAQKS